MDCTSLDKLGECLIEHFFDGNFHSSIQQNRRNNNETANFLLLPSLPREAPPQWELPRFPSHSRPPLPPSLPDCTIRLPS